MKNKILLLSLVSLYSFGQIKSCPKDFLCAKTCGLSEKEATEDARVEIAKNFQVKVKAKFTSIESSNGKLDEGEYSDFVSEEVSENLFGVEMIESFVDEDSYYCVLMGLNTKKFISKLRSDISDLKKENEELYNSGNNLVFSKIRANNSVIKKLELYMMTLVDKYKSNIKKYDSRSKKDITLHIYSQPKFEIVDKLLISELNKNNVFSGKSETRLNIAIALIDEFLNVDGFVKKTLEINFRKGKLNITKRYTQTGRSENAIIKQVVDELADDIPDIFVDLKI
ncbi:LPP20 family lipoprotein [Halobacteriovorax sp. XZX-3]|uniref:LPP20 family lipoprotein n=1 Tax=unclassified Halobacteriovorax TaxID=2639665 RepID=UPI000CD05824|nr:LPP20 family lipoprotein [Halobacteriovorax sp. DA5]POB13157.1 hypothetical protein C0Z22_11600 [Halobacteriovorax sp. DA5]